MQLTAQLIEQLAPPEPSPNGKGTQAFYRDSGIIGFAVRVASGGAKSYILERRIRGKVKRITLGRCQAVTFEKARKRAIKLNEEIERENTFRIPHGKITAENINLQEAYTEYLAAHPTLSPITLADYQRSLRGPLKGWETTPIRELNEERIFNRHESYSNMSRARCNNAMRLLRAILNHAGLHLISAEHKPIIKHNPVDILNRRGLWYPTQQTKNQAGIDPAQLQRWWQATQQLRKAGSRDYLQFLLLTGLPHAIAASITFDNIDFRNNTINITDRHGKLLILPITNFLNKLLHNQFMRQSDPYAYVFPGQTRDKPIADPRASIKRVQELSQIHFTLNDLHRTFMYIADKSNYNQPAMLYVSGLFQQKHIVLSNEDIRHIRAIQESVYTIVSGLTGTEE